MAGSEVVRDLGEASRVACDEQRGGSVCGQGLCGRKPQTLAAARDHVATTLEAELHQGRSVTAASDVAASSRASRRRKNHQPVMAIAAKTIHCTA